MRDHWYDLLPQQAFDRWRLSQIIGFSVECFPRPSCAAEAKLDNTQEDATISASVVPLELEVCFFEITANGNHVRGPMSTIIAPVVAFTSIASPPWCEAPSS